MDEAFSALDTGTRREMQGLVRELWKSTGTTILFVTHNIDEALRLGTRVVVLAKEGPDTGSRVALDLAVPDPCGEDEIPRLIGRLERNVRQRGRRGVRIGIALTVISSTQTPSSAPAPPSAAVRQAQAR